MTLGGLALAVGILVDDATVTIENINRHLEEGMDVTPAILEGSRQITVPALVSTLSICIVFVPMFLLTGVARYLFVPLAEAVVFAMLTSYVLSRTLVPTLCMYWLRTAAEEKAALATPNAWQRFQRRFETRFEALRERYHGVLKSRAGAQPAVHDRASWPLAFASMIIYPFLGRNFFPEVDAGQIKLHVRGPTGFRVEDTAGLVDQVEAAVRKVIPPQQISSVVDNIGLAVSSINVTYSTSGTVGSSDADVLISLKPGHAPTSKYVRILRRDLPRRVPGQPPSRSCRPTSSARS